MSDPYIGPPAAQRRYDFARRLVRTGHNRLMFHHKLRKPAHPDSPGADKMKPLARKPQRIVPPPAARSPANGRFQYRVMTFSIQPVHNILSVSYNLFANYISSLAQK